MAAAPTFQDLLTIPTQDDVLNQEVLPEAQKRGARTTDWFVGGVYRTFAFIVSLMRVSVRTAIAAMLAAGFEDYAFGFAEPPPAPDGTTIDVTSWAPIIAQQRYGVIQVAATYTRRTITLTNSTATPYGPLQPGSIVIRFPSGNRYVLDQLVTIAGSTATQATFRSEFASDSLNGLVYNDQPGQSLQLVTANFAGVTATNPAPTYSPVAHIGPLGIAAGTGTIALAGLPAAIPPHYVTIRIDGSGQAGVASWSYSLDGAAFVSGGTAASFTNLGAVTNLNGTLTNGSASPSFLVGETYSFTIPGSDVTQVGADVETPQSLGARCRGLWPSLAFAQDGSGNWIPASPTASAYVALALSANSQVRIVFVGPGAVNNELKIIIAGQGGQPLSPAVVANVQAFFNSYSMATDLPVVVTSTARAITLAGLVLTVKAGQLSTAQATLTQRLNAYLGGLDPGAALSINGVVDYDYIISLARTTQGVTRVTGTLTINGVASDLTLPVTPGAYESATWSQSAVTAFGWTTGS